MLNKYAGVYRLVNICRRTKKRKQHRRVQMLLETRKKNVNYFF